MKRVPILDVVSLLLIVLIGADLVYLNRRVDVLSKLTTSDDDLLDDARLLPMKGLTLAGIPQLVPAGRRQVVFYMTPRCGSCRKEMPEWKAVAQRLGPQNVLFLIPDTNSDMLQQVSPFLAENGLRSFAVAGIDHTVMQKYHMMAIPRTMIVNADGVVEQVWRGAVTADAVLQVWGK